MNDVICLMGPTASGKTDIAVQLVEQGNYDIISVDSALIYRTMDIGTAKPDPQTLAKAPHRLVDICDPSESYSAADFCRDATQAISEIHAAGKTPLLVGGTMLYFKALQQGLSPLPPANPDVRAELDQQAAEHGWDYLHHKLAHVDPDSAARIHPNDPQRIQRALEIYTLTGMPMTEVIANQAEPSPYQFRNIAITPYTREQLRERIAQRFMQMLDLGFVAEVERLKQRPDLHLDLPSMRAVGYRQVWQYLDGEYDYDTMVEKAITATRQLAKRQMTWLRAWPDLISIPAGGRIQEILHKLE